eukprot:468928_1
MSECLKSLGMIGPFSMLNHRLCHGKESLFFVGFQGSYLMKKKYYSMCFPFRFTAKPLVFDACPHNLFLTHAHRRMVNNKNKYIIMVRNPIKKIESNYTHSYLEAKQFIKFGSLKKSLHRYSSYEQAIKTNLNNEALIHNTLQVLSDIGVDDEVPYLDAANDHTLHVSELWLFSFLERTKYYSMIQRLCKNIGIGKENVLVIDIDDFDKNLDVNLNNIVHFCGIEAIDLANHYNAHKNKRKHNLSRSKSNVASYGRKAKLTYAQKLELYHFFKEENQ